MLSLMVICFDYLQIFAISGVIGENNITDEKMLFKTVKDNSGFVGLMDLQGYLSISWTSH